jgi:hypothetical protein
VTDPVAANGPESTWRGAATKKGKANLTTKDTKSLVYNQMISEPFVAFDLRGEKIFYQVLHP